MVKIGYLQKCGLPFFSSVVTSSNADAGKVNFYKRGISRIFGCV